MSPNPSPPAERAASVFAALGDPTRLGMFARLCYGETLSISRLTEGTGLTRQGVTKHLNVLESAQIVVSQRVGRENQYTVRMETVSDAKRYLERAATQWDHAIERLKYFVEDQTKRSDTE